MLADEPTGNLDTANSKRIFEVLQMIARETGLAMLIVTHNAQIGTASDHVFFDERRLSCRLARLPSLFMIYLDVTSAAASPVNMGVQRTVRGLYAHLKNHHAVTPVRWDFFHKRYSSLSEREQNFLDHPFASYQGATATPGLWDWRFFYKSQKDAWTRKSRGLDHATGPA